MKNLPNFLTALRIPLSILLLFIKPLTPLFLFVYSVCGVSDILDGAIARKANSVSAFGSKLDSIADTVFLGSALIALLPKITVPAGLVIWILLIAAVRIASMTIVYRKYHTFALLHTYANKITGLLLFCFPYFCTFMNVTVSGAVLCAAASISAAEELAIVLLSKELSRNIPGIFSFISK